MPNELNEHSGFFFQKFRLPWTEQFTVNIGLPFLFSSVTELLFS